PSAALVRSVLGQPSDASWRRFEKRYRAEMARPGPARLLEVLALLSRSANFSVGCYCENEARCHRSILRGPQLLQQSGDAEDAGVVEAPADDLHAERQPVAARAPVDRRRGLLGHVV